MALAHSPQIITNGLVLYLDAANQRSYPGSGTTWTDLSGNGNNGILTNGPTYSSDNLGSINFDGVNDYTNLGNILNNVIAGPDKKFTVSVWANFQIIDTNPRTIISKYGDVSNGENQRQWTLFLQNYSGINEIRDLISFDSTSSKIRSVRTSGANLSTNQYYNIVYTYDATSTSNNGLDRSNFYINCAIQNKTLLASAGTLGNMYAGTARLSIGATIGSATANSSYYSNQKISNLQIHNRILSQDEIKQNFNTLRGRYGI